MQRCRMAAAQAGWEQQEEERSQAKVPDGSIAGRLACALHTDLSSGIFDSHLTQPEWL